MEKGAEGLIELAIALAIAIALGLFVDRARQPAAVGYIAAGVVLGPSGLALIREGGATHLLAELGVMMLLFVVGLELSLKAFRSTVRVAIGAVMLQSLAGIALSGAVGLVLGWSWNLILVIGFILSLSSTAVAFAILERAGELRTHLGRTAIAVLIAQDLAFVPMIIVTSSMGGALNPGVVLLKTFAAIGILTFICMALWQRERVHLPITGLIESRPEIAPVMLLGLCLGSGALLGLMGLSAAYGAFLAGLILGNSDARKPALEAVLPLQSVLVAAFFGTIGLLIDLRFVWEHAGMILAATLAVTLGRSVINILILRWLGEPLERAIPAGSVIAQLGEFGFVLAGAALATKTMSPGEYKFAISVVAASLMFSPVWQMVVNRAHERLHPRTERRVEIVEQELKEAA